MFLLGILVAALQLQKSFYPDHSFWMPKARQDLKVYLSGLCLLPPPPPPHQTTPSYSLALSSLCLCPGFPQLPFSSFKVAQKISLLISSDTQGLQVSLITETRDLQVLSHRTCWLDCIFSPNSRPLKERSCLSLSLSPSAQQSAWKWQGALFCWVNVGIYCNEWMNSPKLIPHLQNTIL